MSSSSIRNQVLATFKRLHQTRKDVFKGDAYALDVARRHINDEYSKNKHLTNEESIAALLKHAEDVEEVMRKTIIQAVRTEEGHYRANIRKDIQLLNNVPYKDMPDEVVGPPGKNGACKENQ